mmetsp:Transcript_48367/g.155165  ORF Transcript_48367/g.155165 Transcript_48367/m.155165 type:complete len:227 (+) Transcript_48367:192-872(+)
MQKVLKMRGNKRPSRGETMVPQSRSREGVPPRQQRPQSWPACRRCRPDPEWCTGPRSRPRPRSCGPTQQPWAPPRSPTSSLQTGATSTGSPSLSLRCPAPSRGMAQRAPFHRSRRRTGRRGRGPTHRRAQRRGPRRGRRKGSRTEAHPKHLGQGPSRSATSRPAAQSTGCSDIPWRRPDCTRGRVLAGVSSLGVLADDHKICAREAAARTWHVQGGPHIGIQSEGL